MTSPTTGNLNDSPPVAQAMRLAPLFLIILLAGCVEGDGNDHGDGERHPVISVVPNEREREHQIDWRTVTNRSGYPVLSEALGAAHRSAFNTSSTNITSGQQDQVAALLAVNGARSEAHAG